MYNTEMFKDGLSFSFWGRNRYDYEMIIIAIFFHFRLGYDCNFIDSRLGYDCNFFDSGNIIVISLILG